MTPQTPSQFRNAITLRIILAWAILLSPLAAVKAEKSSTLTAEPSAVDSLTPQSVAALTIRPAQLFSNPVFESLPIEVVEAASQKYLGISSTSFARITAVVEPPMGIQPYYAIEARLTEAMTLNGLHDELKDALDQKMTSISIEGRPCLKADQAAMPCIYMPDDYTILIAPMGMLNKLLRQRAKEQEKSDTPPLAAAMTEQGGDQNDLHAALRMEPILPLIQLGMTQVRQEVEPKYRKYLAAIEMIKGAVLAIDISGERDSALTLYANSEEEAEQLNLLLDDAIELFRAQMFEDPEGPYVQLAASGDPVQEAAARYIERAFETEVAQVRPQRQGTTGFDLFRIEAGEIRDDPLIYVAIIGVLVALLLPAVQAAREAARRNASLNNMKQLVVSMLNYESERKFLPTQAIYDDDESPLLSWRVAVLPYLGEQALYDRFLLDEPWDSPHNIQLLPLMPEIFIDSPVLATQFVDFSLLTFTAFLHEIIGAQV